MFKKTLFIITLLTIISNSLYSKNRNVDFYTYRGTEFFTQTNNIKSKKTYSKMIFILDENYVIPTIQRVIKEEIFMLHLMGTVPSHIKIERYTRYKYIITFIF